MHLIANLAACVFNHGMSSPQKLATPPHLFGAKEAADALNEHGFLFQQVIREDVEKLPQSLQGTAGWRCIANEYPVTASDSTPTRIDLVLQSRRTTGIYLCLECKRPNVSYKTWLFFDRHRPAIPSTDSEAFLETITVEWLPEPQINQRIDYGPLKQCPAFNYYVEASFKRGQSGVVSSTETIEKALRQVIAGSTGLLMKAPRYDGRGNFFRAVPVLITTAEMSEVAFATDKVSRKTGTLDAADIQLAPLEFCAVNYHADDSLSVDSRVSRYRKADVQFDLRRFQIRTVFLVQSMALEKFLTWADAALTVPFSG